MKRSRGRSRRQQNPVNRSYDSNGPEIRVRGTAIQVYEKYQSLARDAMVSGDRIMAENLSQHGEHYFRIALAAQPSPSETRSETMAQNGTFHETPASEREADKSLFLPRNGADEAANGATDATDPALDQPALDRPALDRPALDQEDTPANQGASRRRGPLRRRKGKNGEVGDNHAVSVNESASEPANESASEPETVMDNSNPDSAPSE